MHVHPQNQVLEANASRTARHHACRTLRIADNFWWPVHVAKILIGTVALLLPVRV